jgi:hypothetical protein
MITLIKPPQYAIHAFLFYSIFTTPLFLLRYDTPLTTSYHQRHEWEMINMPNGNGLTHGMGIRLGTLCRHGKRLDLNNVIHEHIEDWPS